MKRQRILTFAIASLCLTAAAIAATPPESTSASAATGGEVSPGASPGDENVPAEQMVIATVNDEPVYVSDLLALLGIMHEGQSIADRGSFDLDRLVERAVNDELLAQEGRALGMLDEDPTADQMRRYRESVLRETLEREQIDEAVQVTDEEVRASYDELYRRVNLRVATVYEEADAEALLARIRDGADFGAIASAESVDPYRDTAGLAEDLPFFEMQSGIRKVVFDLEPGELGGPVVTDLGWSVFRVESFQPADPEAFEDHRRDVASLVRFRKTARRRDEVAKALRQRYPTEILQDTVDAIVPERLPDGRLIPKIDDPSAPVVRIGDHVVTAESYGRELLERWSGVRNEVAAVATAPIVLNRVIQEETLRLEAKNRAYDERPEVRRRLRAKERELLVRRYLEEIVASDVEVTIEEMKTHYEENRDRFRPPPRVRVSQITVATEEEAEAVVASLRSGADFAWVARQRSTDRFSEAGGDRGWMNLSAGVDDRNDALLAAEPGDVLDPIGVPGNWIVQQVTAKDRAEPYTFQEVSGNIRQELARRKFLEVVDRYVTTLRERSDIEIHQEVLGGLDLTGTMEAPGASGDEGGNPHGS